MIATIIIIKGMLQPRRISSLFSWKMDLDSSIRKREKNSGYERWRDVSSTTWLVLLLLVVVCWSIEGTAFWFDERWRRRQHYCVQAPRMRDDDDPNYILCHLICDILFSFFVWGGDNCFERDDDTFFMSFVIIMERWSQ